MEEAQQGSNGPESQTAVIPTSPFAQIAQQGKTPPPRNTLLEIFLFSTGVKVTAKVIVDFIPSHKSSSAWTRWRLSRFCFPVYLFFYFPALSVYRRDIVKLKQAYTHTHTPLSMKGCVCRILLCYCLLSIYNLITVNGMK